MEPHHRPPSARREIGSTNRALLPWLLSQRHKHNKACCPLEGVRPSPQQVRPRGPTWSSCSLRAAPGSHQAPIGMVPLAARPVGEPGPRITSTLPLLGGQSESRRLSPLALPIDRVSEQVRVPGRRRCGRGGQHSGLPAQQVQERDVRRGSPLRHRAHPWGHQAGGEGVPGVHPVRSLAAWDVRGREQRMGSRPGGGSGEGAGGRRLEGRRRRSGPPVAPSGPLPTRHTIRRRTPATGSS